MKCCVYYSSSACVKLSSITILRVSRQKRKQDFLCECSGCLAKDCGNCKHCLDMPRYGGAGKIKKRCLKRKCENAKATSQRSNNCASDQKNSAYKYATEDVTKVYVFIQECM